MSEALPIAPRVATIKSIVAQSYGMDTIPRPTTHYREEVWPRQVAIYLTRRLTGHSLHAIGRMFHLDHTTIHFAIASVERRMGSPAYRDEVDALRLRCAG